MKIHSVTLLASLAIVSAHVSCSAATVIWSELDGPGDFVQGNVVDLNGNLEGNAATPISFSAGSGGSPAQTNTLVFETSGTVQATFSNAGSAPTEGVSASGVESQFGLIGSTNQSSTSTGQHGDIIGGVGQPSALALGTFGGPLEQNTTVNKLGVNIDFSGFSGGSVSGVNFFLAGITSDVLSSTAGARDRVRLIVFDENGAQINLDASAFTFNSDPTFITSGLGTGEVLFTGDDMDTVSNDHNGADAARSNVGVDLGSQLVSSVVIEFEPEVFGTNSGSTAGFAIGDIGFQTVPEPSAAILGALGFLAFLRRKR